ncbi:hypothetical protein Acr_28g0004280 [Actinidia rufa]|uniref:Uncharacterized protein n=1 Tax=Actinidia rufa TaxID=165716 RepID=A0A7J0H9D1_9ERIC|nr:hypothetical protein Acr_28g0004280 [Actinidia rufa]
MFSNRFRVVTNKVRHDRLGYPQIDVYEKQLAELCPGVFQEGWLACLKELEIPPNHPVWAFLAPPVQLPASPARYSPIILPDFNEEEYATLPKPTGVRAGVEETFAEGAEDGEAKGENVLQG